MLNKINFYIFLICCLLYAKSYSQAVLASNPSGPATANSQEIVPFSKLITKEAKISQGLFTVYVLKDRYYFEIKDSILERPILIVSRILQSSTAADKIKEGYAGDEVGENTITFNKVDGKKIQIRNLVFAYRSLDSTENGLVKSILKNNLAGIVMSFDIKAHGPNTNSSIIDVTDFVSGNSNLIAGGYSSKALQSDKSYTERIRSFPINTEVQGLKTYSTGKGDSTITLRMNTSFLLLPKTPMRDRFLDPRIGYFTPFNFDFDKDPQNAAMVPKIVRWRLEPRREDIDKYMRGELVEPIKPIVFYIDPATPKVWIPYLIQGVNDWQAAFERAGFKNAIIAKEVPAGDTTWSMDDARHNVIVYKPSLLANAMGPNIMDARSGEIMESHVSWYHNIMTLLHNWYLLQAGLSDPRARKQRFDDELMGQLIRFVSSHEIGHTLGLKHNFGSSSTVPVDSLRNKKWVELHGHTPSIMDYARFNYVAQPEDHISEKGLFPRIGEYDKWAIEWGYRLYPKMKDAREEGRYLFNLVTDSLRHNPRLYYGEQGYFGITDPRCQNEDLSDNVIKANTYGIKNLKRIMPYLPEWSMIATDQFGDAAGNGLRRIYSSMLLQYFTYQMHVVNTIGLGYYNNLTLSDNGKVFSLIPKSTQQQAMAFLNREVFMDEPKWLTPDYITDQVWLPSKGMISQLIANDILTQLLYFPKLINLNDAASIYGNKTYGLDDFLNDLDKGIWAELTTAAPVGSYHRYLQQTYIDNMVAAVNQLKGKPAAAVIRGHISSIMLRLKKVIPLIKDKTTIYHYNDIVLQFNSLKGSAS